MESWIMAKVESWIKDKLGIAMSVLFVLVVVSATIITIVLHGRRQINNQYQHHANTLSNSKQDVQRGWIKDTATLHGFHYVSAQHVDESEKYTLDIYTSEQNKLTAQITRVDSTAPEFFCPDSADECLMLFILDGHVVTALVAKIPTVDAAVVVNSQSFIEYIKQSSSMAATMPTKQGYQALAFSVRGYPL